MVEAMREQNFLGKMEKAIPMKKSRLTEAKIISVLRQAKVG